MSRPIGKLNEKSLTSYWGGEDKGVCLQITNQEGYIQLSASEIAALLPILKDVLNQELTRKKAECDKVIEEHKEMANTIAKDMSQVAEMTICQTILDYSALLLLGKTEVMHEEG